MHSSLGRLRLAVFEERGVFLDKTVVPLARCAGWLQSNGVTSENETLYWKHNAGHSPHPSQTSSLVCLAEGKCVWLSKDGVWWANAGEKETRGWRGKMGRSFCAPRAPDSPQLGAPRSATAACGPHSPAPSLGCPLWTLPPSPPPGPLKAGSLLTDVVAKKEHVGPFRIIFRKFKKRWENGM